MKQRVRGGWVLALVCASAVSCGGSDAGDTASTENPGTSAVAGTTSPATTAAGAPATGAKAGTTGSAATAAAGTTGAATAGAGTGATGTAGTKATAGSNAAAAAGGGAAGMSASAAAGTSASGAAGMAAAAGSAAAGGCGSESFAAIYDSIFKNATYNCTGALCHGREPAMAMAVGNLSLSSAAVAYMQLVKVDSTSSACMGKARVVPGDPMNSLLVQKLRGANVTCGAAMPVNAEEITDAELKRITDWISAGACNN